MGYLHSPSTKCFLKLTPVLTELSRMPYKNGVFSDYRKNTRVQPAPTNRSKAHFPSTTLLRCYLVLPSPADLSGYVKYILNNAVESYSETSVVAWDTINVYDF